ncbi:MAG TPA: 4-hydroxythreonine-4-phosphate dehydrogenase PdxA, partial [Gammaproteobacteria bacterium]|nr:4-hydroxythreonine-4-phosphate dehydrogenase PdxA [Gammaproteobacteria bacterium]
MDIAITAGDPAGIGPDLVLQLAQQQDYSRWVVIADPDLLQQRARALG